MIDRALSRKPNKRSPAHGGERDGDDSVDGEGDEGSDDVRIAVELRRRVRDLEQRCDAERRQAELAQREKDKLSQQLVQFQEQVHTV